MKGEPLAGDLGICSSQRSPLSICLEVISWEELGCETVVPKGLQTSSVFLQSLFLWELLSNPRLTYWAPHF